LRTSESRPVFIRLTSNSQKDPGQHKHPGAEGRAKAIAPAPEDSSMLL
jgi:hypothetical protein